MEGVSVEVDSLPFGHIDELGFFTDPTVIREFMRVSPGDLKKIAERAEEISARLRLRAIQNERGRDW